MTKKQRDKELYNYDYFLYCPVITCISMSFYMKHSWMCKALARCHSPSLSNYRCDLHILLNAVSILLFGVISPLPLLEMTNPERPRGNRRESAHLESLHRRSGISWDLEMFSKRRCKLNGAWWWKAVQVSWQVRSWRRFSESWKLL